MSFTLQSPQQYGPIQEEYGFCWDNVQLGTEAKHQSSNNSNTFLLQAMTFSIKNRVSFAHLNNIDTIPAEEVDPYSFIPDPKCIDRIKHRMIHLTTAILTTFIPYLSHLQQRTKKHIQHEYSAEMQGRSTVVNMWN